MVMVMVMVMVTRSCKKRWKCLEILKKKNRQSQPRLNRKDKLKNEIAPYLKDLMINIRFTNFRFTVLGEVRLPGSYIFPTDKVTVLEALGQAGDMTQYAVKENVRVIRDSSGKRSIGKVDFTQKDIFNSPFYYLQRNDVVYIETNKNKTKSEQFSRASSLVATFTSIIAIAITVFRK